MDFYKKSYFILQLLLIVCCCKGQKKEIDTATYSQWERLSENKYRISNNGKFVLYEYESAASRSTLVIATNTGIIIYKTKNVISGSAEFSNKSNYVLFQTKSDSIGVFNLINNSLEFIHGEKFKIVGNTKKEYAAYFSGDNFFLQALDDRKLLRYGHISQAYFNNQKNGIVLKDDTSLYLLQFPFRKKIKIIGNRITSQVAWNESGNRIAFFTGKGDSLLINLYNGDSGSLSVYSLKGLGNYSAIEELGITFSDFNNRVLFKVSLNDVIIPEGKNINSKLIVWNYKDEFLPTQGGEEDVLHKSILEPRRATLDLETGHLLVLESRNEVFLGECVNNLAVIRSTFNPADLIIETIKPASYFLLNMTTGIKIPLYKPSKNILTANISSSGNFITWQDTLKKELYCYSAKKMVVKRIATDLSFSYTLGIGLVDNWGLGTFGWTKCDDFVIMMDQYDIFQVDPNGKVPSICLTKLYGRKKHIKFKIIEDINSLSMGSEVLSSGFLEGNKYMGLFKVRLGDSIIPNQVIKPSPCLFHNSNLATTKARDASLYLLVSESDTFSPNLIILNKKNSLDTISQIHPEKTYNWLTSELHSWESPNGQKRYGILYKPENFDSSKKYPVIFHYYEMRSDELYKFYQPGFSLGIIDIPTYVSNGYLVFVPDIWKVIGESGKSALTSVSSAAAYLSKLSFVDTKRLGLQGHSFGGYETNYIAVKSNLFAAAQSSAGISDWISLYGDVAFGGRSQTGFVEVGQPKIEKTLWEARDLYINNSPIFFADQLTTPILLTHGTDDIAVPYKQALSFFLLLRRLNKPSWLLSYQGEGHLIGNPMCSKDFTVRQMQFFDHYLKGKPTPKWMIDGSLSLELDTTGKCSDTCPICNPGLTRK